MNGRGAFVICGLVVAFLFVVNVVRLVELDALGAAFDLLVTLAVLAGLACLYLRSRRPPPQPKLTRRQWEALHFHYTKNGIPETQTAATELAGILGDYLDATAP